MSVKRCETCGHETVLVDPPAPPTGYEIRDRNYVPQRGDLLWECGTWYAVFDHQLSIEDRDLQMPDLAPMFIASPIPKPFRISEHGPGLYETRDGREATVERKDGPGLHPWSGTLNCGSEGVCRLTWKDCGMWRASDECASTHDLVRYLGPLEPQKPSVDPGEGWRLLGESEFVEKGDEFVNPQRPSCTWSKSDNWMLDSKIQEPSFIYRRRVTPLAPQEQNDFTPTDLYRLSVEWRGVTWGLQYDASEAQPEPQKTRLWKCGDREEWRPVEITDGAG